MPSTYTPLRYPGGKTKYTDLFVDILSMNDLTGCTFVEVFAGGAGAAIKLLLQGRVKALFLNDLDVSIYSFWKMVKERPSDLIELIETTPVTMTEWHGQRAIYQAQDTSDPLALGFATFFLNRCNRSGILGARPVGGMNQSGTYRVNSRYNKNTSIAKIQAIADHAHAIEVFNMDGLAFLTYLRQRRRKRKCLLYLDPPYFHNGPALYLNHFEYPDHRSLRDHIANCRFPWVLSYDKDSIIIDLYKRITSMYTHSLRHTITGNTLASELIMSPLEMPNYLEPYQCELVK